MPRSLLDPGQILQEAFSDSSGGLKVQAVSGSLITTAYDYQSISYDVNNNPTTIVYKLGGASGTVVSTLTIVYDVNNNPTSITKT